MNYDDHKRTIGEAIESIAPLQGSDLAADKFKRLVLADFDRLLESRAAFDSQFLKADCWIRITVGCSLVSAASAPGNEPDHGHTTAPVRLQTSAQQVGPLVGWGGGHCWTWGRCWICIEAGCQTGAASH